MSKEGEAPSVTEALAEAVDASEAKAEASEELADALQDELVDREIDERIDELKREIETCQTSQTIQSNELQSHLDSSLTEVAANLRRESEDGLRALKAELEAMLKDWMQSILLPPSELEPEPETMETPEPEPEPEAVAVHVPRARRHHFR